MSIKTTVFLVFCQSFLRSFFDHLGLFTPTEYWSCSHIPDAVNALATTVEMAIVGLFQLDAFKSSEISLPELPAFARLSGLRTGHLDGHPVPGRPDPGGAEYTKLRHATSQGANGMDFQAAFGLDPGHARVRDREWVETHAASPTGVGQGGVQGGESVCGGRRREYLLRGRQKQIKLGLVHSPFAANPDPQMPPARQHPFRPPYPHRLRPL
ncbi:hypothetical protein PtA15_2A364 [Puccinia triticina]|uniref:Uncharacterized protein n=1 Tax=Puccinia triticina TaxID=208348 RepID=A0ABY7CA50_9BASI|nr:uncharacterized protein PtA15_2A364 [Puccinia triticina]WAQ82051.1 hypothetical protein PtA15_2A364 [Puccinia triticina]